MNSFELIKEDFLSFLKKEFSLFPTIDFSLNTDAQKASFGDINSNAALVLSKLVKQSPRVIAQKIKDTYQHPLVEKIEIAGPGFLNFFLTTQAFIKLSQALFIQKKEFFKINSASNKKYNLEFVSANPTGPLHIGHGRGGMIGDVLGNILDFIGYTVTKEHYINDAGLQINKLGDSLKVRCLQLEGQSAEIEEGGYHGEYLIELAKECITEHGKTVIEKDNAFFTEYAYTNLLALLKRTVAAYNIHFDVWFSEKTLHPTKIIKALELLEKNGYLYKEEGALFFRSTTFGDDKDRVLKKANGEFTYAAADAAYLVDKAERGFNHLILVLGQDHHSYPKRLEGLRQALGLSDVTLECIIYQLVSIKESGQQVRLSKRAGRIIGLLDIVETVGTDIARFFYLNRKADAHLEFDIDLALKQTDENPVYYLQYAYVRTNSILRKAAEIEAYSSIESKDALHLTKEEQLLIKKLVSLKELLFSLSSNFQVHLLAYYLLDLAQTFHNYYHFNKVLVHDNIPQTRARLFITQLVKEQFDYSLTLMGLSLPQSM